MRLTRCLVPTLAAACLFAGEAAPVAAPVPVTVRLADGVKLQQAWDASLYAKVWADPAVKPLREKWAEAMKEAETELGFNPIDLIAAIKGARVQFLGMQGEKPKLIIRADLGAFAGKVIALAAKEGTVLKPVQVAGADEAIGDEKGTFARFGNVLVVAFGVPPTAEGPTGDAPAALSLDLDAKLLVETIASAIPADKKAEFDKVISSLKPYLGTWTYRGDIVAEGIRERVAGEVPSPGIQPVDRSILARLPATTLMALSWGFDGKSYWKTAGETLLNQADEVMHSGAPLGAQATAQEIQDFLAAMGIQVSPQQIIEGLSGTGFVAITQGVPFPAITLAIPRSTAMDQLVELGLKQIGNPVPAEGASEAITIPDTMMPIAITLIRDQGQWVLTTDLGLAGSWTSGAPGGFADTAMAKTLFAKAPAHSYLLGASDTPAVLRTIQGYLGMALGMVDSLTPEQKQAISGAILRLAGNASTGYVYGAADAKHSEFESRGLIGLIGLSPLSGILYALPFYMNRHGNETAMPVGPEAKAMQRLSSEIFPAEIQFQASSYADQDGDKIGEYATLAELAGIVPAPGKTDKEVLFPDYKPGVALDGYLYAIYLPDSKGGVLASSDAARAADKAAADAQEQHFVVYAWPADKSASRMFSIDQTGVIYEQPFTGEKPAWNALYGGQGWDGVPAWQSASR